MKLTCKQASELAFCCTASRDNFFLFLFTSIQGPDCQKSCAVFLCRVGFYHWESRLLDSVFHKGIFDSTHHLVWPFFPTQSWKLKSEGCRELAEALRPVMALAAIMLLVHGFATKDLPHFHSSSITHFKGFKKYFLHAILNVYRGGLSWYLSGVIL